MWVGFALEIFREKVRGDRKGTGEEETMLVADTELLFYVDKYCMIHAFVLRLVGVWLPTCPCVLRCADVQFFTHLNVSPEFLLYMYCSTVFGNGLSLSEPCGYSKLKYPRCTHLYSQIPVCRLFSCKSTETIAVVTYMTR